MYLVLAIIYLVIGSGLAGFCVRDSLDGFEVFLSLSMFLIWPFWVVLMAIMEVYDKRKLKLRKRKDEKIYFLRFLTSLQLLTPETLSKVIRDKLR